MILEVKGGRFSYDNKKDVFSDVNFSVSSGELLAILGPNGAGKTTLLRCMTGMLKWKDGKSLIDGSDIRRMGEKKLWSIMSYVPQARGAATSYSALETVLIGRSSNLSLFSSPGKHDIEKAESVLEELSIAHLRDKPLSKMSGGELQMVLIARALVSDPQILILDEPESNLDFKNQLIVLNTISRLASDGICCIFNTHYPEHALQRADRSLILSGGKTIFGSTSQVLTEENIERTFGVKAIIGEIETPHSVFKNVVPLKLSDDNAVIEKSDDEDALASITIIADDFEKANHINALLHEYGDIIIGRMGMPYRKRNVFIINTTFDGKKSRIEELSHRLSLIPSVSVKTVYQKDTEQHK